MILSTFPNIYWPVGFSRVLKWVLSWVCVYEISYSVPSIFILLAVSFDGQKFLILMLLELIIKQYFFVSYLRCNFLILDQSFSTSALLTFQFR